MPGFDQFFRKVRDGNVSRAAEAHRLAKADALLRPSQPVVNDSGDVVQDIEVLDAEGVEARVRRRPVVSDVPVVDIPPVATDPFSVERQRDADFRRYVEYKFGRKLPYGQRQAYAYVDALSGRRRGPESMTSFARQVVLDDRDRRASGP